MANFKVKVPIAQNTPTIQVDGTDGGALPLGENRFSLVVIDDSGNESAEVVLVVKVVDSDKPTAVLNVVNGAGAVLSTNVPFGSPFILSAAGSVDKAPGKIREYRFTLLDKVS